ncbi:hypothetical protein FOC27_10330 [Burkholderia multivorans]|uniref:hypothetical protein n=1 Tax=Burkholderia multivorans TaxID=87883 RepID=UPI0012DFB63E|nr:hypothetical protein [Burkholderia multivorans]MBU9341714.1 hypothetical protein [Burkholderia multivorans]MCA8140157.1 hypothetical protein [Burkholderia multivorans]QGR60587.1 hypothetical protein FOC27_10330 [Burkholderia multivorans]
MSTKRRFRDRVEVEREVLSLVNRSAFAPTELCGLTVNAIETWAREAGNTGSSPQVVAELAGTLRELAERCRLNADQSRDVFDREDLVSRGTIDACIAKLERQLKALGVAGSPL